MRGLARRKTTEIATKLWIEIMAKTTPKTRVKVIQRIVGYGMKLWKRKVKGTVDPV